MVSCGSFRIFNQINLLALAVVIAVAGIDQKSNLIPGSHQPISVRYR